MVPQYSKLSDTVIQIISYTQFVNSDIDYQYSDLVLSISTISVTVYVFMHVLLLSHTHVIQLLLCMHINPCLSAYLTEHSSTFKVQTHAFLCAVMSYITDSDARAPEHP